MVAGMSCHPEDLILVSSNSDGGQTDGADGGRRDVFLFNFGTATNVWFDGLRGISLSRGCAMQLSSVEEAGGRQVPRHREAGRRKHGTTMTRRTPRKGRLRPGKLQLIQLAAVSTCVLPKRQCVTLPAIGTRKGSVENTPAEWRDMSAVFTASDICMGQAARHHTREDVDALDGRLVRRFLAFEEASPQHIPSGDQRKPTSKWRGRP